MIKWRRLKPIQGFPRDVEMPEFFSFQVRYNKGRWWEHGVYFAAKDFVRHEDGSYVCQVIGSANDAAAA